MDGEARPIVLTPGYQDDPYKVNWLVSLLRHRGLRPLVISPQPSNGSVEIQVLAKKLAWALESRLGPEQPVDLFGFSMGGLIHRVYVQQMGGVGRVRRMMTVATPHRGSLTPTLLPSKPALRQMCRGSDLLTALNADLSPLRQLDFLALWTPFDLSVLPGDAAYLPGLPERRVFSPFHGTLLRDPMVLYTIVEWFRAEPVSPPDA
jgi:triacylglycerol lipase